MPPQPASMAVPGQLLGPASAYQPGTGTHLHESSVYASILGTVSITQSPPAGAGGFAKRPLPTVSVARHAHGGASSNSSSSQANLRLPDVGSTVLCRVTRVALRQATVAILAVSGDTTNSSDEQAVLEADWQGVIRVQDVRATEKDRVRMHESFRPGDIVRAEVISLGDQANYYLSTARNELGVIMATSEAGNTMYPVSWKEYRDAETGQSESRKVAKPF